MNVFKYKHGRFLHIIIRHWTNRKHPYFTRDSIFTRLSVCIRFINKFYPSTIYILACIHYFKKMNIDAVVAA